MRQSHLPNQDVFGSRSTLGRQGFTVVELLIASLVFLVLLGALGGMLVSSTRGYEANARASEAIQDSEAVLQLLRYDIGLAGYRGLELGQSSRSFELDGPSDQSTVRIEPTANGHTVTVRYFEDRYISGADSGERRVTYLVNASNNSLERLEYNPIDGELDSALMVGNIESLEAVSLVDLMRVKVNIDDVPCGVVGVPFGGIVLRVGFTDGSSWDLLIPFTNSQKVEMC